MTEAESTSPLDWFVDALLQSTGQLMLIVDHMSRYPSDDAEPSFDAILRELLADALEPAYRERDPADFASAAAVMVEARSAIADELVLVDPDTGADRPHGNGSCDKASEPPPRRRRRG